MIIQMKDLLDFLVILIHFGITDDLFTVHTYTFCASSADTSLISAVMHRITQHILFKAAVQLVLEVNG